MDFDYKEVRCNTRIITLAHSAWQNLRLEPPCDLRKVTDFLGIEVIKENMPPGLMGMFSKDPEKDEKIIMISNSLSWHNQRFILGHELGHAVSTHKLTGVFKYYDTYDFKTKEELLCDEFSKHLVMPELYLRKEAKRIYHNRPYDKTGTLAGLFDVSYDDMKYRLKEIGLN